MNLIPEDANEKKPPSMGEQKRKQIFVILKAFWDRAHMSSASLDLDVTVEFVAGEREPRLVVKGSGAAICALINAQEDWEAGALCTKRLSDIMHTYFGRVLGLLYYIDDKDRLADYAGNWNFALRLWSETWEENERAWA